MPIANDSKLTLKTNEPPQKRVAKRDRGFSPDGSGLRPSTINLAARLYAHALSLRQERAQTKVYASGIKDCARKIGFSLMGFPKEPVGEDNPQWTIVADIGTEEHELLETWLRALDPNAEADDVGYPEVVSHMDDRIRKLVLNKWLSTLPEGVSLSRAEFRVASESGSLSGRVDAELSVQNRTDGRAAEFVGVDVKTVGLKDFEEGAWGRKVPGYVQQLQVYGRLCGWRTAIILLVCRNDGRMLDIEFDIDPKEGDRLIARADWVWGQSKERTLLPAEEKNQFSCGLFCPFKKLCDREEATGEVQWALDLGKDPLEI